eukprot:SAG22_NODE_357_length_11761_cov_2.572115_2_plen_431_part_00
MFRPCNTPSCASTRYTVTTRYTGPCEHNWGYSVGNYLPELRYPDPGHPHFTTWPNKIFHTVRNTAPYQRLEDEWAEQREWMHPLPAWSSLFGWSRSTKSAAVATGATPPSAVEARQWNAFVHELEDRLAPIVRVEKPVTAGMAQLPQQPAGQQQLHTTQQCGDFEVAINSTSGAIGVLKNTRTGRVLAAPGRYNLGTFAYYTYSSDDFAVYGKEYVEGGDFGKTGMETANAVGGAWYPDHTTTHQSGCSWISTMTMPAETTTKYGAPAVVTLNATVPGTAGAAADLTLRWHDKTATRIGEAMWLSFTPPHTSPAANWSLDVMGYPIDPLNVANGGTRFKHAVGDGATLHDGRSNTQIKFIDSAILAPGDIDHLLRFCRGSLSPGGITDGCADRVDPLNGGVHANLYNNLWGTAFPQWYDDDGMARFQVFG